jgi:hypothetical protein
MHAARPRTPVRARISDLGVAELAGTGLRLCDAPITLPVAAITTRAAHASQPKTVEAVATTETVS